MNCLSVPTKFKTFCFESRKGKRILLASNSKKFIARTITLITEYTKKIDPSISLTFPVVKQIHEKSLSSQGFTYRANIQTILPRTVRLFYGKYQAIVSNCHGTALVSAGIFPVEKFVDRTPLSEDWVYKKFQKIKLKDIATGDLVYLDDIWNHHSFVYLSHEVSISMNGIGRKLKLYPTSDILEQYGFSRDALISKLKSQNIRIYRKVERQNDFEPVMPVILEYWKMYSELSKFPVPAQHPKYFRILPIHDQLKNFVLTAPRSSKDAAKALYYEFLNTTPDGLIPENRRRIDTNPMSQLLALVTLIMVVALVGIVHESIKIKNL